MHMLRAYPHFLLDVIEQPHVFASQMADIARHGRYIITGVSEIRGLQSRVIQDDGHT